MKSVQAVWNGVVIAETDDFIIVEGNHYFPLHDVHQEYLKPSSTTTYCPWKGESAYFSIHVDGEVNEDAAWIYPKPHSGATRIKNFVAFWRGVEIVTESEDEKRSRLETEIRSYLGEASSASNDTLIDKTQSFFKSLDTDNLLYTLPQSFIEDLSFFNFQNSNNLCFHTNYDRKIMRVNPTFEWALGHLPSFIGMSFCSLFQALEVVEGPSIEDFTATLDSHGWVHVPRLRTKKDDTWFYYTLDVAITKHGSLENLSGIQGELRDITREVELGLSLESSEANIRSLIDGLEEGLFFFDREGQISPDRSAALAKILPGSDQIHRIQDFAARYSGSSEENICSCLELLWQDDDGFFSDFETSVTMLPKKSEIISEDTVRTVHFSYRSLNDAHGKLDKVIVMAVDVTEKLERERENLTQAERVSKLSKAASNRDAYLSFEEEMNRLVHETTSLFSSSENFVQSHPLKRNLHTLKGSLASFGFNFIASYIHKLEDMLDQARPSTSECLDLWKCIEKRWLHDLTDIRSVLGLDKAESIQEVSRTKLSQLAEMIRKSSNPELIESFSSLFKHPPALVFSKYHDYLLGLNERFPEKDIKLVFDPSSSDLSYHSVQRLDSALIHIFRNCFDHGIENSDDRVRLGKAAQGEIKVLAKTQDEKISIILEDDGAGINGDKLAQKALKQGIWSEDEYNRASYEEKIELIFSPQLSSKDEISDVSGRGVGMDAVRSLLEELGGRISVHSQMGKGTRFELFLPLSEEDQKAPHVA